MTRLPPCFDPSLLYFSVLSLDLSLFYFLIHGIRITCGDGVDIRLCYYALA